MEMTEALNTFFIQGTFIPHSIQFSISYDNLTYKLTKKSR